MSENTELRNRMLGITTEVGGGIATDFATSSMLAGGPLGWLGYGLINFGQGAYTNYLVQKHLNNQDKINVGEVVASGFYGLLPFMNIGASAKAAKYVGKAGSVQRGLVGGGLYSLAGEQLRVGIDEKRVLQPTEAVMAGGLGSLMSGGLAKFGQQVEGAKKSARIATKVQEIRQATQDRLNLKYNLQYALSGKYGWRNRPRAVNTLEYDTVPKLIDRLNDVADELGFDAPLNTVPLKKARKGSKLADEYQSIWTAYETAYWRKLQTLKDADPTLRANMETFPDLIHEGVTYRPDMDVDGFGILKGASIVPYNLRAKWRSMGKTNRLQDLSELNSFSGGSTKTFNDSKSNLLDKLNKKLEAEGKDPLGAYLLDGDHRLPVVMTARYGKGLSPKNKRIVYNAIVSAGGALGDEPKNVTLLTGLINRQKQGYLGKKLRALKHKPAKSFKTQKARVQYYTTPSERTFLTPIEEYVQAVYLTEVWAEEQMNAMLKALPIMKKGVLKTMPKEQYELLVEIFGSRKNVIDFFDGMEAKVKGWVEDIQNYDGDGLALSKEEMKEMLSPPFIQKIRDEFMMGEIEYRLNAYWL